MPRQSRSKFAAIYLMVQALTACTVAVGGTGDTDPDGLGALKPPDIIAQLVQNFPGSTNQSADKSAQSQYFIVQRNLDSYVVAIGSNLTVQSIATILDKTKQSEVLQANVFFWFHQSGVLNKLDAQSRLAVYRHIEKTVRQSQGEAFRVGVGLLRRLLKPEGANAAGNEKEARLAAAAILEMTRERLMQGVRSDKEEEVAKSVLGDVQSLRRRGMVGSESYAKLLQSCITNLSLRGSIRVRSANLLVQESSNSVDIVRLLQTEADDPRNDEAVRKDFHNLLDKK